MDSFINVIKMYPQAKAKIKDISDRYNRLPYTYQSKKRYDTLIQNVIPKEMIILMSTIIVDVDIVIKMKFKRIKYLENILF